VDLLIDVGGTFKQVPLHANHSLSPASLGRTGGTAAGGDVRRRPSAKFMSEYVKTMRERVKSGKENVEV
jgi:hypothetical protein